MSLNDNPNCILNIAPGQFQFPVVVYTVADKDIDFPVTLSEDDIRTIIDFLLDVGEDMSMLYAFREYNKDLYDRVSDEIEEYLTKNKIIGPLDEYGIAFPVEIQKEADRIRLEI